MRIVAVLTSIYALEDLVEIVSLPKTCCIDESQASCRCRQNNYHEVGAQRRGRTHEDNIEH